MPKRTKLKKATSRTGRTTIQMTPGGVIIGLIEAFNWADWNAVQLTAVFAAVTLLSGYIQNALESRGAIPHILEEPVTPKTEEATKPEVVVN